MKSHFHNFASISQQSKYLQIIFTYLLQQSYFTCKQRW